MQPKQPAWHVVFISSCSCERSRDISCAAFFHRAVGFTAALWGWLKSNQLVKLMTFRMFEDGGFVVLGIKWYKEEIKSFKSGSGQTSSWRSIESPLLFAELSCLLRQLTIVTVSCNSSALATTVSNLYFINKLPAKPLGCFKENVTGTRKSVMQ